MGDSNLIFQRNWTPYQREISGLLVLWQANCGGGKNLVPKIWRRKFPYQVKVKLVIAKVTDVPKKVLAELGRRIRGAVGNDPDGFDE